MPRTERVTSVDPATADALRGLWARALESDGVGAVSEAFRLAVGPAERPGVVHLLRFSDDDALVGYAQVAAAGSPDAVAELVVDPSSRRKGHGRALLDAALGEGARSVWSHGMLPAAEALAAAAGLVLTRSLYRMTRPLTEEDRTDPVLPQGFTLETFADRPDAAMLQRINAAAFANHPEQGRLSVSDIQDRVDSAWFDARGLFLLLDEAGPMDADPVGFHWTKVETGSSTGEVYVVGVAPDHRGRGLARPLTAVGLAHLARLGLAEVELYVDGENAAARRTYERLGFTDAAVDGQYSVPTPD